MPLLMRASFSLETAWCGNSRMMGTLTNPSNSRRIQCLRDVVLVPPPFPQLPARHRRRVGVYHKHQSASLRLLENGSITRGLVEARRGFARCALRAI
jgi:hypothetical protein